MPAAEERALRVRDLHDQVSSPARAVPYADEDAWCALVDSLVATVREEERTKMLAVLDRLAISALALSTPDAVARLIKGVADREYRARDASVSADAAPTAPA